MKRSSTRPFFAAALAACAVALAGCAAMVLPDAAVPATPVITAFSGAVGDRMAVSGSPEAVLIGISSERGIGQGSIARTGDRWPDAVTLRFHLKGLEGLDIESSGRQLHVEVQSHGDRAVLQEVRRPGDAGSNPIAADDPLRMIVTVIPEGPEGSPGGIDVALPAALLAENPEHLELRWIDFYR